MRRFYVPTLGPPRAIGWHSRAQLRRLTPNERTPVTDTASLITLRSILDLASARSYQWDAATIIAVSGVDRAGDLTTRVIEDPGVLCDIADEGFSPHSPVGHALSHALHDAIQRRVRLWITVVPTAKLDRLREALGGDLIHEAGLPSGGHTPVAMSPLELLETWSRGNAEQREFMRVAMAGLDTLTTSSRHPCLALGGCLHHRALARPQAVPQSEVHRLRRRPRLLHGACRARHVRAPLRG